MNMLQHLILVVCIAPSITVTTIPLFQMFNNLKCVLAHISLAQLPTPVFECVQLENALQSDQRIFIKRDDLTGIANKWYGGNKVRKLEFLLADAKQKNATEVITVGALATNHGLATACHAQQCGFACTLLLAPHLYSSKAVYKNILLDHFYNARILLFKTPDEKKELLEKLLQNNPYAYFIPVGGSNAIGSIGYVNAACELKQQIDQGILPEPLYIYLPAGSFGTIAGLLLGCALVGIESHIIGVLIEPYEHIQDALHQIKKLFKETNAFLHACDSSIPIIEFPQDKLMLEDAYGKLGYGRWNVEVDSAMSIMQCTENVKTEGTYSGKAVAALIADICMEKYAPQDVILLWHTYCGLDFSTLINTVNYKDVPEVLHEYFES